MKTNIIGILQVGDIVIWYGSFGSDAPAYATIESITHIDKDIKSINWSEVNTRDVIVTITNSKWAYGNQLTEFIFK